MLLGALRAKAVAGFSDNAGLHLLGVLGNGTLLAAAFVLDGQIAINVFNLYGAFMPTVTVIEPFAALKVTPVFHASLMLVICAQATALCPLGPG
ncbi:hypothetical protein [Pseudomonas alloputida]|uniref:hypothetical protein n=1 Tax=Pseudomonas TaxID=286 RepID=UPI003EEB4B95